MQKRRKVMKMKKKYEKPVATILAIEDYMQVICSSGFENQTNFKVNEWGPTEETDANGESKAIDELPGWLSGNP
ncbi:hypothetical protein HMPREF9019_1062 [Hoylesella timonensis CRIS 5C-B1]|uniref:Uncharacterized protein n=2 Tax=Hoylesella timonensis TaxID=386414 RepID=D1VY61_9BACT|nr:hypothetical protein HMPREF9019_1062 [Hoylesella timonensis CRIS 5C-B1]